MKYLIVYIHPNPKSFNHAIKETVVKELTGKGAEIKVRDLYNMDFDPVLKGSDLELQQSCSVAEDVRVEQELIQWADTLVFISPILVGWHAGATQGLYRQGVLPRFRIYAG